MKNQKAKYVLFPVVGLIWCLVILRYLGVFDADPRRMENPGAHPSIHKISDSSAAQEQFTLLLNYPDPFTGELEKSSNRVAVQALSELQPVSGQTALQPKAVLPGFDWKSVHFSGMVKIAGSDKSVGLLRIGGQTFYAEAGNNYAGLDVLRLFPDSIWVKVEKERKTIRR